MVSTLTMNVPTTLAYSSVDEYYNYQRGLLIGYLESTKGFVNIGVKSVMRSTSFDIKGYLENIVEIGDCKFQYLKDFWENTSLGVQVQILPNEVLVYTSKSYYPTPYTYSKIEILIKNLEKLVVKAK